MRLNQPARIRRSEPLRGLRHRACSRSEVNWVTAGEGRADLVGEGDRDQPLLEGGMRLGLGPHQEPALEHAAVFHQ